MISTRDFSRRETVMGWLSSLEKELTLLEQLTDAASRARAAAPERDSEGGGLHRLLERQAELCAQLEQLRRDRARTLADEGHRADDLLVVALGAVPKDEHPAVIDTFKRYVDAAEAAQREIDINREFFSVALATLEDTIEAVVSGVRQNAVYDANGSSTGSRSALCVSTVT